MADLLQSLGPAHASPEQGKDGDSTESTTTTGPGGSPRDEELHHIQVLAHARSVATPPAVPCEIHEIEVNITCPDLVEDPPKVYIARREMRPSGLTEGEIADIVKRLELDLESALREIKYRSQRKPWIESLVMIEMRMGGVLERGSTKVTLRPCIWIFCGSKWCRKIVKRPVKALSWLEPYKVYFVRKGDPQLVADRETSAEGPHQVKIGHYDQSYYEQSYNDPEYHHDYQFLPRQSLAAPTQPSSTTSATTVAYSSYPTTSATSSTGGYEYQSQNSGTSHYGGYSGYDSASVTSSSVPSYGGGGVTTQSVPSRHSIHTDVNHTINRQGNQGHHGHHRSHRTHHSRLPQVEEDVAVESSSSRHPRRSDHHSDRHRSDQKKRDHDRGRGSSHKLKHRGPAASGADATRPIDKSASIEDHNSETTKSSNDKVLQNIGSLASHAPHAHRGESVSGWIDSVGMQRKDEGRLQRVRRARADLATGELESRAKHNQNDRLGLSSARYHDKSITLPGATEHLVHVRVQGLISLIGMSCISTTRTDQIELSQSASKVGGAVSITVGGNTSLYGVTAGHGLVRQTLNIAPKSADESSIDELSEESDSVSEDEDDSPSLSAESVFSGDGASINSAVDLSASATWILIDHGITADFLGIGLHPDPEREFETDELHVKDTLSGDIALFPIGSFHRPVLKNFYMEPGTLREKEVTSISENECESSLPVVVLLGFNQSVSGTLQPGKFHFSMRGTAIDARQVRLSRDLAPGCSGSWVVHDDTLYGMIVAVFPGECMALMIPSTRIISDIERLFPGATDISVAIRR